MNTQKSAYWIALVVFAFALHSQYRHGAFPTLHRAADQAGAVLCRVVTHAEQNLAIAQLRLTEKQSMADEFFARRQANVDRLLALHQAEIDRAMALRQAHLDRVRRQVERARFVMDRVQLRRLDLGQLDLGRLDLDQLDLDQLDLERQRGLERLRSLSDASTRRAFLACPETGLRMALNADLGTDATDLNLDSQ